MSHRPLAGVEPKTCFNVALAYIRCFQSVIQGIFTVTLKGLLILTAGNFSISQGSEEDFSWPGLGMKSKHILSGFCRHA